MIPTMQLGGLGRRIKRPGGSDARRFGRLNMTANNGDTYFCLQEVKFSLTPGGADVTSPSTIVVASSTLSGSYPASKVVDNSVVNDQDVWVSAASPGSAYLIFDFGAGFDILTLQEMALMAQNNAGVGPGRAPLDFTFDYGPSILAAGPWTNFRTVTGATGWTAGVFRTYSLP